MRLPRAVPSRVVFIGLVGLLAVGATPARAQQTLSGVVVDTAGKPIQNADVGVVSLRRLTRTDSGGRFSLQKLPLGALEVSVRRLGFEPSKIRITIAEGVDDS